MVDSLHAPLLPPAKSVDAPPAGFLLLVGLARSCPKARRLDRGRLPGTPATVPHKHHSASERSADIRNICNGSPDGQLTADQGSGAAAIGDRLVGIDRIFFQSRGNPESSKVFGAKKSTDQYHRAAARPFARARPQSRTTQGWHRARWMRRCAPCLICDRCQSDDSPRNGVARGR